MAMVNCPRCGVSNRAGSNFCNNCGASLGDVRREREPEPDADAPVDPIDETDAPGEPAPPPASSVPFQQPWLQSDDDADDEPAEMADSQPPERLITGVQGLLEPSAIAALPDEQPGSTTPAPSAASSTSAEPGPPLVDDAEFRLLRRLMNETPTHARWLMGAVPSPTRTLRIPLLFWLIGIGLALPILMQPTGPTGAAHEWPGVAGAFAAIDDLPAGAHVLTYWAYDPATAGEMDSVVQPVLTHLIGKQSQLIVATPLPGGMPMFTRLLDRVIAQARLTYLDYLPVEIGFLPGENTVLPLLGQDWQRTLDPETAAARADLPAQPIALSLVVAARAEYAQHWLEQVAPLNHAPVILVTSAAAEPILRPYLDSGQVQGMVSGFDGGGSYWSLLRDVEEIAVPAESLLQQRRWLIYQNWGHMLFILVIVVASVHSLLQRKPIDDEPSHE